MTRTLLALLLAATPVAAQPPMTAAEFEAYVTGRTLTFSSQGIPYGVEEYREGRRVRWSFLDGRCKEGRWYPSGPQICFVYEDDTGPQCWTFRAGPGGLRARHSGDPEGTELYETHAAEEPMMCLGPEVGV